MIKNLLNGRSYIGQTVDYKKRVRGHFSRLNNDIHPNRFLQNSWNKSKSLIMGIVCECDSLEELNKKEIELISKFKTHWTTGGYNIESGGQNYRMCESSKQKLREKKSGLKQTKETIEKRLKTWKETGYIKKIHRYTLDGWYVDTFDNVREASKVVNRRGCSIAEACTKETVNCGGYLFSYKRKDKLKPYKPRQHTGHCAKEVVQCDKEGNAIQEYRSITEASKQTKTLITSITNCLKGRSNTAGGYMWKFKEV